MPPSRERSASTRLRVAVVGAGSIGCYVGGRLATAGDVTLIGRPRVLDPIRAHGLTISTLTRAGGSEHHIAADQLSVSENLTPVASADVVLVCVKSRDTKAVAEELARHLTPGTPVVSLQNGLRNADRLRDALARNGCDAPVIAGMVGYNVVQLKPGHVAQTTSGDVMVGEDKAMTPLLKVARAAGMPLTSRRDIVAVQHAKLLLNLNNAINALSGQPLKTQLQDLDFRRVLAANQQEALHVFAAAKITPAQLTPLPAAAMVRILRLPTPVFGVLARTALSIDPRARSSMADDLDLGRPTEIAELQGEVSAMGRALGIPTPISDRIAELVHAAESAGPQRDPWTGPRLLDAVTAA